MKNVAIPILITVIFLIMAVYLVMFQVRETESALVKTPCGRENSTTQRMLHESCFDPIP